MTVRCRSTNERSIALGILLFVVAPTAVHAQVREPAPPYLQANAQFITVRMTFDEAAIRNLIPANVRPTPSLTGGINIYQAPAGYPIAPYSGAYVWVDVEGYDSPDGTKGRWMLQGVYGPEPAPTVLRENLGWPVRAGASRSEITELGKRGVASLGDREVISVEIQSSTAPCRPVRGAVNYLSQASVSKKLVVNEIPFVGQLCDATPIAVKVQGPEGDPISTLGPTGVLWAGELRGFTFSFSRPKPVE